MSDISLAGKRFNVLEHDSSQMPIASVKQRTWIFGQWLAVESMVQEYRRQRSRDPDLGVPLFSFRLLLSSSTRHKNKDSTVPAAMGLPSPRFLRVEWIISSFLST